MSIANGLIEPIPKAAWQGEKHATNGATPRADVIHSDAGAWEPCLQKLCDFQRLGDDWDGAGAKAPSGNVLASAVGLAYVFLERGVAAPSRVVPGIEGSVLFEWQFPDGGYAEVEVTAPFFAEVMYIEQGKPPKHWTLPTE